MEEVYLEGKSNKKFRLIKKLGSGGFGEVYEAEDVQKGAKVAIKIFRLDFNFTDQEAIEIWQKEAQQSLAVKGQNVVQYIEFNKSEMPDGSTGHYLVMELAQDNLEKILVRTKEKGGFITEQDLVAMFGQILNGLKSVHEVLIHRDLKPQNILISKDNLKISDFGLAKYIDETTRTKSFKGWGTAKYMAPESWTMGHISRATDIYSLGVVFYQMATFELPFSTADTKEMEELHRFGEIPSAKSVNNSLSHKVEGVIRKMMQKSPADRYQKVEDVELDLANDTDLSQTEVSETVPIIKELLSNIEKKKSNEMKIQELYDKNLKIVKLSITDLLKKINSVVDRINKNIPEEKIFLSKGSDTNYTLIWNKKDLLRLTINEVIFSSEIKIEGAKIFDTCFAVCSQSGAVARALVRKRANLLRVTRRAFRSIALPAPASSSSRPCCTHLVGSLGATSCL